MIASPFDLSLIERATALLALCRSQSLTLATVESCTGGLVSGVLTEIPGSSDVVDRGFVTYSNAAKSELVRVPADLILAHGAVSEPVARAMAEGALSVTKADLAVAITGVAGPSGGTATKPVGLVHFAVARRGRPALHREHRYGDLGRAGIRLAAVSGAIDLLTEMAADKLQA